ncbi:HDOD domain-containing protein [bacterium]|nr:MAG: HDOD domain-containing protein [bacterium]
MVSDFLMARQPIFDRNGKVYAYELLYRTAAGGPAGPLSAEAEHRSIVNAVVEVGLSRLAGSKLAFFNVSPQMLHSVCIELLPPDRVVLELLENTVLDAATERRMAQLKSKGYRLAYDDFTFQPHQLPFMSKVGLVKIDVMDTPWQHVQAGVARMKANGVVLLAEKVEDRAMYDRCVLAGFDLFQGYFFSKPQTVTAKGIDPQTAVVLKLLNKLNRPDVSAAELEEAIAHDPTLAAKLLKMVNSAGFGTTQKIGSVFTAIQMLGIQKLQAFATVLAASSVATPGSQACGDLGLVRARMCERMARDLNLEKPHKHFTVGLLSVLDAMMDLPMRQIVAELSLSDDVTEALIDPRSPGNLGRVLRLAKAFERGAWSGFGGGLNLNSLNQTYSDAVEGTFAMA